MYVTAQRAHVHRLFGGRDLVRRLGLLRWTELDLVDETPRPVIREHVVHIARRDTLLVLLSEVHLQQIRMVLHEDCAHARVAQKEGPEGLREDIVRADRVPDLA